MNTPHYTPAEVEGIAAALVILRGMVDLGKRQRTVYVFSGRFHT